MRVAVVDIGTNSTRLYIADVDEHAKVRDLLRRSEVTRLGEGVDRDGGLTSQAMARVFATLDEYRQAIAKHRCQANLAVLTSAVRDASNGAEFTDQVSNEYGLDAHILSGDEEASMTFLGAMSNRPPSPDPTVVIDVGGGSTELIIGTNLAATFHTSLQAGVVRMSERHIHSDPPSPAELQDLAQDTHTIFMASLPRDRRTSVKQGIAVAGTATSAAAIDQELDPYDPNRVHGYTLQLATIELLLARLADMNETRRRQVTGLHPDRAPTIVAGMILLGEALQAFGLDQVEVSEHDILQGGALRLAGFS
jgi:exopolyphosphatase / guanosine-5'-triphosphate,3'-diphosphate pyrophosphatase